MLLSVSLLLLALAGCSDRVPIGDAGSGADSGGERDSGADDAASRDSGAGDDGGAVDGGAVDGGAVDGGAADGASGDASRDGGPAPDAPSMCDPRLGAPCEETCAAGFECMIGRCTPQGREICGGFAGAPCTEAAYPHCLYFSSADFGTCLDAAEVDCLCRVAPGSFSGCDSRP